MIPTLHARGLRVVALLATLLLAAPAAAEIESVMVVRASEDAVVIEREGGARFRLAVRQDCVYARGTQGHSVLLWYPNRVLTPDARILMPEYDVSCRVWGVDTLPPAKKPMARPVSPDEGLAAVRNALELMGYPCGPASPAWNDETAEAFTRYRESRQLDSSTQGVRRALTALAIDMLRGRQATGTGLKLSTRISDHAGELTAYLVNGAGGACTPQTFVRAFSEDGQRVTLGDGTIWQLDTGARTAVGQWSTDDGVMACSQRLINTRTGEMVRAGRLR
jgi:hypothetical protein